MHVEVGIEEDLLTHRLGKNQRRGSQELDQMVNSELATKIGHLVNRTRSFWTSWTRRSALGTRRPARGAASDGLRPAVVPPLLRADQDPRARAKSHPRGNRSRQTLRPRQQREPLPHAEDVGQT